MKRSIPYGKGFEHNRDEVFSTDPVGIIFSFLDPKWQCSLISLCHGTHIIIELWKNIILKELKKKK